MGRRGTNGQSQGGERDGLVALGSAATALGSAATAAAVVRCSRVFYRYIDLTNQQVFRRRQGRITSETWHNWCEGIAHPSRSAGVPRRLGTNQGQGHRGLH
jgi:hypothetical protein